MGWNESSYIYWIYFYVYLGPVMQARRSAVKWSRTPTENKLIHQFHWQGVNPMGRLLFCSHQLRNEALHNRARHVGSIHTKRKRIGSKKWKGTKGNVSLFILFWSAWMDPKTMPQTAGFYCHTDIYILWWLSVGRPPSSGSKFFSGKI